MALILSIIALITSIIILTITIRREMFYRDMVKRRAENMKKGAYVPKHIK